MAGTGIAGERVVDADACVIGAGAGGAVAAKELAEGGMSVAMLEEGEWHDTDRSWFAKSARINQTTTGTTSIRASVMALGGVIPGALGAPVTLVDRDAGT